MASEQITKVKFKDRGLAGIVVSYEKPTKRQDFNYRDEYVVTYKASIHDDLKFTSDALKQHVRAIGRLDESVTDEEIRICGVSGDGSNSFIITYQVRSFGDTWCPAANTPKMDESIPYDGFFECCDLINMLYNEVRAYIKAEKKINYEQLAIDFAHKDKKGGEDIVDVVQAMTPDEKVAYYRNFLEDNGAIVIMDDEMSAGGGEEFSAEAAKVFGGDQKGVDDAIEIPAETFEAGSHPDSIAPEAFEKMTTGFGKPESGKILALKLEPTVSEEGESPKRSRSMN